MFFAVRDLCAVNHMYRLSLPAFLALFRRALERESPAGNVAARLALLSEALVELVHESVSRSLFNADRLTFAMHLARHLQPKLFEAAEWDAFLGKAVGGAVPNPAAAPAWLRDELAPGFAALAAALPHLVEACEFGDAATWAAWASGSGGADAAGGGAALPPRAAGALTPFQQLLVVKALKPDRLQSAMTDFCCRALSVHGVSPAAASLAQVIERETSSGEPVLFITTPGADPCQELAEYAVQRVGRERYHEVAMGQGQAQVSVRHSPCFWLSLDSSGPLLRTLCQLARWYCILLCCCLVPRDLRTIQHHRDLQGRSQ